MKIFKVGVTLAITFAGFLPFWVPGVNAAGGVDLVHDILRQQSGAERTGCTAVQRALAAGTDPALLVRTAIELGYNSCQVIRCTLEEQTVSSDTDICGKVIRGAAAAGAQADVISRCSEDACKPAVVAAILSDSFLDLSYCYFAFQPLAQVDALPTSTPVIDRSLPAAQASPFTF